MHSSLYKLILALVILAVAVAFGIVIFSGGSNKTAEVQEEQEITQELPPFASGVVERVEDGSLYFMGNPPGKDKTEMKVTFSSDTEIIGQGTGTDGRVVFTTLEWSEIQNGDNILVYYDSQSDNQFTANKIQVIN